ncbi:MAG TPA: hypothetical protein VKY65_06275 [Alphaproteobacteria bacterium]|nr:hypothetical protein [Alphaproteobacteria bacterium]
MADSVAASFVQTLENICGVHQALASGSAGSAGTVLGNILVAGAAGVVTLLCFAVALRLLIRPGERDSNHPKYRILRPDR